MHAASGGVGLAAIQIAKRIGAEIFATAGSPRKRDYLKSLGIEHVLDSRSLDFAGRIMEATAGEGIDLVVNSLTGETIAASLSVLRTDGRFMELGKTDLWDQRRVDEVRPGVTFYPIALDQMMAEQPAHVAELIGDVIAAVRGKETRSAAVAGVPYPANRRRTAAHGESRAHRQSRDPGDPRNGFGRAGLRTESGGQYLVTGGLGGLGLKIGPVAGRSRGTVT